MSSPRVALAASCLLAAAACGRTAAPPSATGTWSGTQAVTVRARTERGEVRVLSDTVAISVRVGDSGRVEGRIGGATLENAWVVRNRGWLGRALGAGTDYRLEARLQDAIFPGDSVPTKDVHAPFGVAGDTLTGTLFQRRGPDVYPMAALRLFRR